MSARSAAGCRTRPRITLILRRSPGEPRSGSLPPTIFHLAGEAHQGSSSIMAQVACRVLRVRLRSAGADNSRRRSAPRSACDDVRQRGAPSQAAPPPTESRPRHRPPWRQPLRRRSSSRVTKLCHASTERSAMRQACGVNEAGQWFQARHSDVAPSIRTRRVPASPIRTSPARRPTMDTGRSVSSYAKALPRLRG